MSTVLRLIRHVAVIAAVLGGVLLPSVDASVSAGLVVAVLALVVVSVAPSVLIGVGTPQHLRVRAALHRLVPRTAQSDPDACGHARPRAPGRLLTAA